MRNRIKSAIISCITIQDRPILVRRESKEDIQRNQRRAQFNKAYNKGDTFLTQFEMGLMRQLDMFRQERKLSL